MRKWSVSIFAHTSTLKLDSHLGGEVCHPESPPRLPARGCWRALPPTPPTAGSVPASRNPEEYRDQRGPPDRDRGTKPSPRVRSARALRSPGPSRTPALVTAVRGRGQDGEGARAPDRAPRAGADGGQQPYQGVSCTGNRQAA